MKITLLKTSKQNRQHLQSVPMETMIQTVMSNQVADDVEDLRQFVKWAESWKEYDWMYRLPFVYPSVEIEKDKEDILKTHRFTGLLTLSVSTLQDQEEAEEVKRIAAILPCTMAALLGSSGRTVKIIVRICRPNGSLPEGEDEMEQFYRQAFPVVLRLYESILPLAKTGNRLTLRPALQGKEKRMLMTGFRQTFDAQPYYDEEAITLRIPENLSVEDVPVCHSVGEPSKDKVSASVSKNTRQLIDLLEQRYAFRMNTVMGYAEYRQKEKWHLGWRPVDERIRNGLAMEARLAGLNVWDKDINRYLLSDMVRAYNPIEEYLWSLHDKWDGRDYIGALAKTVPTKNKHWPLWFRTWFLAMVAQWLGMKRNYGNAMAPLLISKQGYNKSTFCKSLIPFDLQWGYTDSLILSEKKSVLQAMSQFLLINLDEFNQISPAVQQGFLKNVIQLAAVKVKRPYGKHVEDFPRLASFIATTNETDILADPTGNRRFMGIELTGPIDMSQKINYDQLYAQAVTLLEQGEPTWLDDKQTQILMESNRQFQLRSPEEMFFWECFRIPEHEEEGVYVSTAAILAVIKKKAGAAIRNGNILLLGKFLSNIEHLKKKRTNIGSEYLVIPLENT